MNNIFDSLNTINENSLLNLKEISYNPETSYVLETIEFVKNSNIEFNSVKRDLYKCIAESAGDEIVIHEGFIEFFSNIKKIIDKFLAFIKSLFDRFIINFNKLIHRDKFIINNKKVLDSFDDNKNKFEFEGYKFTTENYPIVEAYSCYIDDLEETGTKLNEIIKNIDKKNTDDLLADMQTINSELKDKLDTEFYDKVRAISIGQDGSEISDSDYEKECFAAFRNNNADKETIEVTSFYITECYNKFEGYTKAKEAVEKDKRKIDSEYNKIKTFTDKYISGKSSNSNVSAAISANFEKIDLAAINTLDDNKKNIIISELDKYMKTKSGQVEIMSNIHALAFAYKLEAMKDEYVQNRNVLFKALSNIKSTIKEGADITININICKKNDDEENNSENIEMLTSDHSEEDDDYKAMPFADNDNDEPEIPVDYTNREEKEFEDAIDSLNAIEMDEIEEAVNIAINTNSPSSLVSIASAKNPKFGKKLLESMINNKVRYLNLDQIKSEKIVLESDMDYIESKASDCTDKDKIKKLSNLYESYKMYMRCLNENEKHLSKLDIYHYDYITEMSRAIAKMNMKLDMIDHARYIKECILFNSDKPSDVVFRELAILEAEEPVNKKNIIEKFTDFIKKIWNKFVERVTYFVSNNKKYLDKYKDTILKRTPTIEVSMKNYGYGIMMMTKTPIPAFNINDFNKDTTKDSFRKEVLNGSKLIDGTQYTPKDDTDTFKSYCNDLFTGGPKERSISGDGLNMADIFDFCYDYESKIKPILEKDKVAIEKSANDIGKLLDNQAEEVKRSKEEADKAKEEKPEQQDNENPQPTTTMPTEKKEGYVYSLYKDKVITELEISKGSSDNNTTSNKASDNLNSTTGTASSKEDIEAVNDAEQLKQMKEFVNIYNSVVGEVMSAKIAAAETIYNDYMKIIIAHVKSQIEDKSVSRDTQNRTDYSNDDNNKKETEDKK